MNSRARRDRFGGYGAAIAAEFGATVDSLLARRLKAQFGFGKPTTAGDNGIDRENETAQQRQVGPRVFPFQLG